MSDELKIDFGDGVSALDRTMRAIVLLTGQAIASLVEVGHKLDKITLEFSDDMIPMWISLHSKRVFEVSLANGENGDLTISGKWIRELKGPGFIDRLLGR